MAGRAPVQFISAEPSQAVRLFHLWSTLNEEDTVKTSLIREAAMMLSRMWVQHIRPMPFERVFYLDGVRVRISIDEYKPEQEIEIMRSEVSSEA